MMLTIHTMDYKNNISVRVYIIYTNKLYATQEILKEELYVQ